MTGFDFGTPEAIHAQLSKVIESEEYQRATRLATREREIQALEDVEEERGFGFDVYKRRSPATSQDTLTIPSFEGLQLGNDPFNTFHY